MKLLVLGAGGLIGHTLFDRLSVRFGLDAVHAALRADSDHPLFDRETVHAHIDVLDETSIKKLIADIGPDVVLNCVGITKRKAEIADMEQAISVNALFPHRLARWADESGFRVIHFSTDCVFDGTAGPYDIDSETTGRDTYGKTKALGEIRYAHTLTIRSSFIGRELTGRTELLEWALSQRTRAIRGFDGAWYSGVSTLEMARVVGDIIEHRPELGGLVQLAMIEPVNKYELLRHIDDAFELGLIVERDSSFETCPTLDGSVLRTSLSLELPSWPAMLAALAEQTLYDNSLESDLSSVH